MRLSIRPELIEEAREGQPLAMESLVRLLWPHLYRLARSILRDHGLAQDAAQEACAQIYSALPKLRSTEAFNAWVYRILTREAARIGKRHAPNPSLDVNMPPSDIDAHLDVLRALGFLPHDLRVVVLLRYYADLSSSEIGAVLGIPSATVRFRLSRARRQLEVALQPHAHISVREACS